MNAPPVVRALILIGMVVALVGCSEDDPTQQPQKQPPDDPTGVIAGLVVVADTEDPIEGAAIVVSPGELQVSTGAQGDFSFGDVPVGSYRIDVSAAGFSPATVNDVEVVEGQTAQVDIALDELLTFPSTCASCHLRPEMLLASLEEDPLPVEEGEGGSAGEG